MKKVIKTILFIVLAVIILAVGGCSVLLGIMNHKNENYWKYTETGHLWCSHDICSRLY